MKSNGEYCICGLHAKINSYSFLTSISRLFCLLSSRILQINLLHLYLVTIRRYKLSFFAKPATKSLPHFLAFKYCGVKLITHRGLGLAKSTPNLAIGSNAKLDGGGGARNRPRPLSSFDTHARWQPVTQSSRSR